jgi:hypothetical protein
MEQAGVQPAETVQGSAATEASNVVAAPGASLSIEPPVRDRIVILGRTQAGKTIFLATLYHRLWEDQSEIAVRGMDGRTHKACIEIVETLRSGRWPSSTVGSKYLDIEVRYKGQARPLVSLDYPGEVFRKAFVDGMRGPDVDELLEHVDRAAAVIALVDPAVVIGESLSNAADDEFGMYKALDRIKAQPGGAEVPVALVLTKWDLRASMVRSAGGLVEFVRSRYRAVAQTAPTMRVFTCSAVQQQDGPSGPAVHPKFKPHGVVAPLRYILKSLDEVDAARARTEQVREAALWNEQLIQQEQDGRRRSIVLWSIFWGSFLIVLSAAGLLVWWLGRG